MPGKVTRVRSVENESAARADVLHAFSGVLNSISGVMGIVVLLGAAVIVYLFSGFIGVVLSNIVQMVGAIALTVLGICYFVEGLTYRLGCFWEDVPAEMLVKEYLLDKFRKGQLSAQKLFGKKMSENMTEADWVSGFKKDAKSSALMYGLFTALLITYAVYGFGAAPLRIFAILAAIVGSLGKLGQAIVLESLEKPALGLSTRDRILLPLIYGLPVVYVLCILGSYIV